MFNKLNICLEDLIEWLCDYDYLEISWIDKDSIVVSYGENIFYMDFEDFEGDSRKVSIDKDSIVVKWINKGIERSVINLVNEGFGY